MEIRIVEGIVKERKTNPLPEIFNRIFAICKYDKSFTLKDRMKEAEKNIEDVKEKIAKQNHLLSQSRELKQSLNGRLATIDENNLNIRSQLLEELGSEL